MTRFRSRLLAPAFALIALGFLFPALAAALPQGKPSRSAEERQEAALGRLSQFWTLLSVVWAETGSILEPDGGPKPTAGSTGDTGSILEPDGRS